MRELAQHAVSHINTGTAWGDLLKGFPNGHVFGACVTGNATAGGVYLLTFAPTLRRTDEPAL